MYRSVKHALEKVLKVMEKFLNQKGSVFSVSFQFVEKQRSTSFRYNIDEDIINEDEQESYGFSHQKDEQEDWEGEDGDYVDELESNLLIVDEQQIDVNDDEYDNEESNNLKREYSSQLLPGTNNNMMQSRSKFNQSFRSSESRTSFESVQQDGDGQDSTEYFQSLKKDDKHLQKSTLRQHMLKKKNQNAHSKNDDLQQGDSGSLRTSPSKSQLSIELNESSSNIQPDQRLRRRRMRGKSRPSQLSSSAQLSKNIIQAMPLQSPGLSEMSRYELRNCELKLSPSLPEVLKMIDSNIDDAIAMFEDMPRPLKMEEHRSLLGSEIPVGLDLKSIVENDKQFINVKAKITQIIETSFANAEKYLERFKPLGRIYE
ncbi:MAG: hypothetical protein EZS28_049425, partial [Streblomastix strix]